ncbi:MAG: sugar-phosphate isomerase, RpiB/LacA/LacB family [Dehalococcoidia bacterium]|nr:sugar-phosphate isomerase, RpiB/LacA/LacB family [Dehalococcoidia bacterium]
MRIAVGSDESTPLTDAVVLELRRRGMSVELLGALAEGDDPRWPEVGRKVAEKVSRGKADQGVLFCWTGTGVSMAANKVPGVRAALCTDAATASGARRWNHANVLVMGLRLTSQELAREMLDAWFSTPPGEGEDADMVARLAALDESYRGVKAH